MAQGTLKKSKPAAPKGGKANAPGLKKGLRTIAPRKSVLVKQNKIVKKLSSGLTAKTERALAEKAGHLELLKGGKNDKKKDAKKDGLKK